MNLQSIYDIAQICVKHNIKHAVLSPGSRCAPLVIAFSRHPEIKTKVIIDERSAAYIALGIAQQTNNPVVLVCTSGTAALNYSAAIAESYYQQIPLIVLTADRPPEWIDQQDGQTIQQVDLYGRHVKKSYQLPVDTSTKDAAWHFARCISEAIILAKQAPKAAVHLNVPIREPFYPRANEEINFSSDAKVINCIKSELGLKEVQWQQLLEQINSYQKVLILSGQNQLSDGLKQALKTISNTTDIVIFGDILANLHQVPNSIRLVDGVLNLLDERQIENLQPDLLISFGLSVLSKNLKHFLRKSCIKEHWHIQQSSIVADTFQALTQVIQLRPEYFFNELVKRIKDCSQKTGDYQSRWQQLNLLSRQTLNECFSKSKPFNEFEAVKIILDNLKQDCLLHLGNSMAVRYANLIGIEDFNIQVYSNRGTSGIDGSVSTALGHALVNDRLNLLIVGDVSCLYDRNAFWNQYLPDNFKVIVLNNHGGGIFKLIEGPNKLPEVNNYFVAYQAHDCFHIANAANIQYLRCDSKQSLIENLKLLFSHNTRCCILEIFTDIETNTEIFQQYRQLLKTNFKRSCDFSRG